ncbi:MAG: glycosyltransferase, partial [Xanthomonadales bacterium]|nr:glycosyltransferase [Xanthomonadales bacterium]
MFEASVIVTTYNRLDALRLALAGFRRQTNLGFEIIVADDGSAEATREFLAANATSHPF